MLDSRRLWILDGGLATELERRGHDLDHPLWSARLLIEDPESIRSVHRSYLDAGADCLIAATYQASLPGLQREGVSARGARALMLEAVELARSAGEAGSHLVAASVGPYGAYLADGSEYRGRYGLSIDELYEFHAPRWEILAGSTADLLACETIPDLDEARALRRLIEATPERSAWVSFSCSDGDHLRDGSTAAAAFALFADLPSVVAVGVNCTAPRFVTSLIGHARRAAPDLRVVVYPNSGERYDGATRSWSGEADPGDFVAMARKWQAAGASLIGGCCRTGPAHIRAIADKLGEPVE